MKMFASPSRIARKCFRSSLCLCTLACWLLAAAPLSGQSNIAIPGAAPQSPAQNSTNTNTPRVAIVPINSGVRGTETPAVKLDPDSVLHGPVGDAFQIGNGIEYHNGFIFSSTPNVYFIWYGNWSGNSATTILPQFVSDLNNTKYLNIDTTYGTELTDPEGSGEILNEFATLNTIAFKGQIFDNYSQGTSLSVSAVEAVVNRSLSNGLPADTNGIYLVLTSPDVTATSGNESFCSGFCGYHSAATIDGLPMKFGFIGNPARCITSCASTNPEIGQGPNSNPGADGMANVMAHEINETITDPNAQNGWYHINTLGEVGDLCNFNFGNSISHAANGAPYNVTFNGRHYLIQEIWQNTGGGFCSIGYATPNGAPAVGKVAVIGAPACDPNSGACDDGTIEMQISLPNNSVLTESIFYDGSGFNGPGTAQGIADALASAFNSDPNNNFLTANVVLGDPYWAPTSNTVYWLMLTTKQDGASLNSNAWTISINSFTQITGGTLSLTPVEGSLVGGANSCCAN